MVEWEGEGDAADSDPADCRDHSIITGKLATLEGVAPDSYVPGAHLKCTLKEGTYFVVLLATGLCLCVWICIKTWVVVHFVKQRKRHRPTQFLAAQTHGACIRHAGAHLWLLCLHYTTTNSLCIILPLIQSAVRKYYACILVYTGTRTECCVAQSQLEKETGKQVTWLPGRKGSRECAYAARRGVITRYRVISRRILRACVNVRSSVRRRDYAKYRVT